MNAADRSGAASSDIPATGPYTQQTPWAFVVVAVGLLAAVAMFALAVIFVDDGRDKAGDIVQVTAPGFALIAGLVGGYFGVRAGSLALAQVGAMSQSGSSSGSQPTSAKPPAPRAPSPPVK